MKIIVNKFIPFPGFKAMVFYSFLFLRSEYKDLIGTSRFRYTLNHESIHLALMHDFCKWTPLGGTIFYIWYFIEWLIRVLFVHPFSHEAYRSISFELEAYEHDHDLNYLQKRKKFNWL